MHAPLQNKAEAAEAGETRHRGARGASGGLQALLDSSPRVAQLEAQSQLLNRGVSGTPVLQGHFLYPNQREFELVREFVAAVRPDLMDDFEAASAGAGQIYLYDWLEDNLNADIHDVYDWDDGRGAGGGAMDDEPPQVPVLDGGEGAEALPQPVIEDQRYQGQPAVPQPLQGPLSGGQQAEAEPGAQQGEEAQVPQWLAGIVGMGEHPFVQTAEAGYWLYTEEAFQPGEQVWFAVYASQPHNAYWPRRVEAPQQQPVEQEQEPEPTVPASGIEQAAARAWLKQMPMNRPQFLQAISGQIAFAPESAREYIDNWNAAGVGEPISLEDVGWNLPGYQAAGAQEEVPQPAPTSMRVMIDGQGVDALILNDSGGYHIILEYPGRDDLIIRQRRADAETTIDEGMRNWEALRLRLGRAVGDAIRVPKVSAQADAYIVERVHRTVDALEMWRRVHQLPPQSDEARMLWRRLSAIRTLIQENLGAMQEGRAEPFPDFRPSNVGYKEGAPELLYIDFDQQGEVKEPDELMDHVRQWAGQRYDRDPGGERDVDQEFLAWLRKMG
jgi:hypothetical protein